MISSKSKQYLTLLNAFGKILHYIMLFIGFPLIILSLISFIQNPFGYIFGYAHSITILSGLSLYFFFYYRIKEGSYIKFTIGVFLDKELIAKGKGLSKQEAEEQAAKNALETKGWQ